MGQMMLALRYGNAQKSSSDTGMRVKDTAQKLVQQGKFVGGRLRMDINWSCLEKSVSMEEHYTIL